MEEKVTLNYKASNIAKAEEKSGKSFLECISTLGTKPTFSDLRFLILAGGGSDEDFDKLFASGMENLMGAVLEGINNAGFLGEKIDVEGLKDKLHEGLTSGTIETSQNSGEATNQSPSK